AAQTAANRQNALVSTGPRSPAGKARSAKNALRHGLRSELAVLPGERPEDWEAHLAGIVQSLAPAGVLETELAHRVALSLWRLRRVAAFETTFVADSLEGVGEDVRQAAARHIALSGEEEPAAVRRRKTEKKLAKQRETVETWEGTLSLLRRLAELP